MRDSLLRGHRVRSINLQSIICRDAIGATKTRGGDMGFFSEFRMPPDFFAAVVKMHVAEISKPIRTRLGFHIIQLTDRKQARRMTFDEARGEIGLTLENEKRQTALQNLAADLLSRAPSLCARDSRPALVSLPPALRSGEAGRRCRRPGNL